MITAKEFLIAKLTDIFYNIHTIDIRYEYCKDDDTHLVEVMPITEFDNNKEYLELEKNLLFEFNNLFFPSTLLFISEDSLNQITVPEFVLLRRDFTIRTETNVSKITWKTNCKNQSPIYEQGNNYSLAA